jgi:hypothetical protein
VPLTDYQAELARLLAANRDEQSYLAGGAAILAAPNTMRYSQDLDYFHDTAERVASAYETDCRTLVECGYQIEPELIQPGYIRAVVRRGEGSTKVEWAYDSSWRFTPVQRSEEFGYQLHPADVGNGRLVEEFAPAEEAEHAVAHHLQKG